MLCDRQNSWVKFAFLIRHHSKIQGKKKNCLTSGRINMKQSSNKSFHKQSPVANP